MIRFCKRCGSSQLTKHTREVFDESWKNMIMVTGLLCKSCGCFHYELDNTDIYEYYCEERVDNMEETVGKYVTDYDVALTK